MNKQDISLLFTYLQSQETAFDYLLQCYRRQNQPEAETKSYENASALMHYIDHGRRFLTNARDADILLMPVLLFYGMTHLCKACLLTKRPNYPETTAVLAHGVSTRKRKKKNYTFLQDEVKIQHNGLFPYLAKYLYAVGTFPFEKIRMEQLFSLIPELNQLFTFNHSQKLTAVGKTDSDQMYFPETLLDSYNLTQTAFIKRIKKHVPGLAHVHTVSGYMEMVLSAPVHEASSPFFIDPGAETIYFPHNREHFIALPELLIHYLLLYNLSMVSRYETEWWGELLTSKAEADFPFIRHFLQVTAEKVPFLVGKELLDQLDPGSRK
ncbi:YaaC family protein [Virgibacillus ihumii]|uniref:YaaC family protein n=1 Tax=Virgibacillus ihumii TaxID=2686091 RepID=UPI00157C321F|nr:YaaC family protein [Virgibacillus ihumii]